jgi:two-component system, NarL family, sensor histidine kinase EvgS
VPRWLCLLALCVSVSLRLAGAEGVESGLTAGDRVWLAAHPVIRVGYDPAWPPFSMRDAQGKFNGIDADLMALFSERLGLKFEFVTRGTWSEVYEAARRREIDVLIGTARTPERERLLHFTQAYLSFPVVIVTRDDAPMVWSELDLVGKRVAGVRSYAPTLELQREYPGLKFQLYETVEEALKNVSEDRADAFVTNLPNVSFVAKTNGLTNLKIAGVMPHAFDLRYAVRQDWPELVGILDRAIASVGDADRQALVHPWIRVDYAKVIRWGLVWKTALGALAVIAVCFAAVFYHSRRLARELAERSRLLHEVEKAHGRLEQLNEDKNELMHMAGHDLRSPLMAITLALENSSALAQPETQERMKAATQQMRRLIEDLLEVHALEEGRREFHFAPTDLALLVSEVVDGLKLAAARKRIALDAVQIEAGLPFVAVDAGAFRQVVDNLLSNAIKFSPPGSRVSVVVRRWQDFVRLEIADQGPGIQSDECERIFAKYVRGSARPTAGEKSTGLGLSIVRQLMTAMNGRVWCETIPAGGAAFIAVIPLPK